jgi:DNA-binding transcriptional LysR family regulator
LSLTVDGQDLLEHARHLIAANEDMEAALGRNRASPSGLVRVGVPVGMGPFIARTIGPLMVKHPRLAIELVISDQIDDLVRDRLDLAVRIGGTTDSSLISRSVATFGRLLVAAPAYLERVGTPAHPSDVPRHACIVQQSGTHPTIWPFTGPDGTLEVNVAPVFSANSSDVVRHAAISGIGIALVADTIVSDDIAFGRLHRLLPDYSSGQREVYVVYPSRRYLAQRTRVVIDYLIDQTRQLDARFKAIQTDGYGGSTWLV